ncbi:hypothetical protein CPB85DRAFT_1434095 [Mucidula mucida]|nr:hypothetical protein CPB85DRAFT_1434095 [Mucidula mucida]
MADDQLRIAQNKLNRRSTNPSRKRILNVEARMLNSTEGLRMARELEAERERDEEDKRQRKRARLELSEQRARKRLELDTDAQFFGRIDSKKKDDLLDICAALGPTVTGTRDVLKTAIHTHFDNHPELRSDPRFIGLFNPARRPRQAVPLDDLTNQPGPGSPSSPQPPFAPPPGTLHNPPPSFSPPTPFFTGPQPIAPHSHPYYYPYYYPSYN